MSRPFLVALIGVKRFIADRGDLAFGVALPIALFALMTGVFGGEASFTGTAHVADLDGGRAASELLDRLERVDGVSVRRYAKPDLDDALDRSAVLNGFVIPFGFTASLDAGAPTEIQILRRGNGGDAAQIITAILRGVAADLASESRIRNGVAALAPDAPQARRDATAQRLIADARDAPPVRVAIRSLGEDADDGDDFFSRLLPGMIVMFLLFSITLGAQTIVEERRNGTLERLLATRLRPWELFAGKFLEGVGRGMLQALVFLVLAFTVLRVGGPLAFAQSAALAVLVAAAASALALIIAAVARTQDQASWIAVFATMFMTVFGGTFFPIGDSGALNVLSRFTLNKYAIDAFDGVIDGAATLADRWAEIAVVGGAALAGLVAARLIFRVSSEGK